MTPLRRDVKAYYEECLIDYPFESVTASYETLRLSDFNQKHPGIVFAYIPLDDGQHWLFKTQTDLDTFNAWSGFKLLRLINT